MGQLKKNRRGWPGGFEDSLALVFYLGACLSNRRAVREPEGGKKIGGALHGGQCTTLTSGGVTRAIPHHAVPPTVSLSMRRVGWPTPTGTLWPSLPQTPTPVSSFMSLPIRLTRVNASGPLPMIVAPFTGY